MIDIHKEIHMIDIHKGIYMIAQVKITGSNEKNKINSEIE